MILPFEAKSQRRIAFAACRIRLSSFLFSLRRSRAMTPISMAFCSLLARLCSGVLKFDNSTIFVHRNVDAINLNRVDHHLTLSGPPLHAWSVLTYATPLPSVVLHVIYAISTRAFWRCIAALIEYVFDYEEYNGVGYQCRHDVVVVYRPFQHVDCNAILGKDCDILIPIS